MNLIQELEQEQIAKLSTGKEIPDFGPGDTVLVNVKVVEGERTRIQAYEGVCIGRAGAGLNENFTVRKISIATGQSWSWKVSCGDTSPAAAGELAATCQGTKAQPRRRLTSSTMTHWLSTHQTSTATRRRFFSSLSLRVATISWR